MDFVGEKRVGSCEEPGRRQNSGLDDFSELADVSSF